jgi:hypothetical protein
MNRDEAERARDIAKQALADSKFEKALRLSTKAERLAEGEALDVRGPVCMPPHCLTVDVLCGPGSESDPDSRQDPGGGKEVGGEQT